MCSRLLHVPVKQIQLKFSHLRTKEMLDGVVSKV